MTVRRKISYVLLALLFLLLAFMLTPAITSAHRVQQRRACENHLRTLYGAMCAYRQAYGKYPEKLSDLYSMFVGDLEVFECPGQSHKIRNAKEIDSLSGYVLFPPDPGEWGKKYNAKPLLCDRRGNHPFKWKTCWYDAVLYEDAGMPEVFWIFDTRSAFPPTYPSEFVETNRYNFPE